MRQLLLLLAVILLRPVAAGAELRASAAVGLITPPEGIPMAGYYHKRESTGVHDDLLSRALILEQGDTRVALVSLDLVTT
ncbi:MAG: hypothetical protein ACR2RV_05320, partial [Verrucomicrobiales bacterium]